MRWFPIIWNIICVMCGGLLEPWNHHLTVTSHAFQDWNDSWFVCQKRIRPSNCARFFLKKLMSVAPNALDHTSSAAWLSSAQARFPAPTLSALKKNWQNLFVCIFLTHVCVCITQSWVRSRFVVGAVWYLSCQTRHHKKEGRKSFMLHQ